MALNRQVIEHLEKNVNWPIKGEELIKSIEENDITRTDEMINITQRIKLDKLYETPKDAMTDIGLTYDHL